MEIQFDPNVANLFNLVKRLNLHFLSGNRPWLIFHPDTAILVEVSKEAYNLFQSIYTDRFIDWYNLCSSSIGLERVNQIIKASRLFAMNLDSVAKQCTYDKSGPIDGLLSHAQRSLTLFVTNVCNFRCNYCYERNPNKQIAEVDMTEEIMKKAVIDFIVRSKRRKYLTINFFGGEPLLNFDLIKKAVIFSKEICYKLGKIIAFTISTNGSLLKGDVVNFLLDHDFGVLVSLDGDKGDHDKCRTFPGGEGTFEMVSNNLRVLLNKQIDNGKWPLLIRSTITKSHKSDFVELRRFLHREYPGARIMVGEASSTISSKSESDVPEMSDAEFQKLLKKIFYDLLTMEGEELLISYSQVLALIADMVDKLKCSGPTSMPLSVCGVCRNELSVSADGYYFPCHRFVGLTGHQIGHVFGGLDMKKVRSFYLDYFSSIEKGCLICWAKRLCQGPCPFHVALPNGGFGRLNSKYCDHTRFAFDLYLRVCYCYHSKPFLENIKTGVTRSPL